jgi:hypothetical protein
MGYPILYYPILSKGTVFLANVTHFCISQKVFKYLV